jgi:O-antigen/teichoic acid export membrane protein
MNNINITRKDVIWNYVATFLHIGVGVILLPFILRVFPQETVAIWTIFSTIIALTGLLDFGFNPSFARNVSYVVSGVKELKTTGYNIVDNKDCEIDYSLFKGLINAMKWFYSRMSAVLLVLLTTVGTYYIHTILKNYSGGHSEVYVSWIILCAINSYSLYTMYYDSLMLGQGLIKRSRQIQIVGQSVYLIVAIVLIMLKFNLIAIVSAQVLSVIFRRFLSYRTIYTVKFKRLLHGIKARSRKEIIKFIYPNAVKMGLTSLGGFFVSRSAIIIGSLYIPLEEIASYGITIQIIGIISSVAGVYFASYQPKIVQYRVQNDNTAIKQIYLKSCLFLICSFIIGGILLLFLGNWVLHLIKSQTLLLSNPFILIALFIFFLEANHGMAGGFLVTKNEVPYFKAALFAGAFTLTLLLIFINYTHFGVLGLILAPGIAQGCYQNWKWPREVIKDLKIKTCDIKQNICPKIFILKKR